MSIHYQDDSVVVHQGDCLTVLAELPDASVDAVATDPPYSLSFMSRSWDHHATPAEFQRWCEQWARECLRIVKPGGHLLSFGGSRTWHRLAAGIEDAGFEIRDSIAWLTGSGFPKSLNIGRDERFCQCDEGESADGAAEGHNSLEQVGTAGMSGLFDGVPAPADEAPRKSSTGVLAAMPGSSRSRPAGGSRGEGPRGLERNEQGEVRGGDDGSAESGLAGRCDAQAAEGELQGRSVCALSGGVPGDGTGGRLRDGTPSGDGDVGRPSASADRGGQSHRPQSGEQRPVESGAVSDERGPQARRGWPICGRCGKQSVVGLGTALKPAFEPIVVARKPFAGTVAANVAEYGTGGLNIDASRIGDTGGARRGPADIAHGQPNTVLGSGLDLANAAPRIDGLGRWPANVALDEQLAAELDEQSGIRRGMKRGELRRGATTGRSIGGDSAFNLARPQTVTAGYDDEGGASRFFPVFRYTAKAPGVERPTVDGAAHPTVKPLDLMRWLVRLVTPPNGVVLDPFAGSGTTAEACIHEHMRCITIERESEYLPLIVARLSKPMAVGFDFGEGS